MTMSWERGRQLSSLQIADNSVSYKYDSNGMRTQKTDNSGTTYYYYDSDKNLIGLTKGNNTLLFYYDSDGNVTSFKHNGTIYYYIKNLQGDIVKIIDQAGAEVAGYVYDAWGNIRSTTGNESISSLNPFRYRGYVYDEESELYYLQSRYYDPLVGRFLNADSYFDTQTSVLGTNMFAYCEDNPVVNIDISGTWSVKDLINKGKQLIKSIVNLAGFEWDKKQKIFYSLNNCWQRNFGYCDLYDDLAPLGGMFISHKKISFKYNNKEWMIWLWKGRYGVTIGSEIGVYIYSNDLYNFKFNNKNYRMKWYRCANDSERLKMSYTLYLNGNKLFSRSSNKTWWLTGFKPNIKNFNIWNLKLKGNLKMKISITFFSVDMAKAFYKKLGCGKRDKKTVNFTW